MTASGIQTHPTQNPPMTSPKERAAEIDRLMALADAYADESLTGNPNPARATLRSALEAALDLGEPRAWLVHGGRIFFDGLCSTEAQAQRRLSERKDGAKVLPLYAAKDSA